MFCFCVLGSLSTFWNSEANWHRNSVSSHSKFLLFVLDVIVHTDILADYMDVQYSGNDNHTYDSECFISMEHQYQFHEHPGINPSYLFIPNLFKEGGSVIFYIAVSEFICSQSSHSIMTLLIGMFFCKGIVPAAWCFVLVSISLVKIYPLQFLAMVLSTILFTLSLDLNVGIVTYMWTARCYHRQQTEDIITSIESH